MEAHFCNCGLRVQGGRSVLLEYSKLVQLQYYPAYSCLTRLSVTKPGGFSSEDPRVLM